MADSNPGEAAADPAISAAPSPIQAPNRPVKWKWIVGAVLVLIVLVFAGMWIYETLGTVSTDDAYVNGHVTFVAPRVSGQVARVLVDDNNRVHRGDLLVQLDKEPLQVQLSIAQTALTAAQADLAYAVAQTRGGRGTDAQPSIQPRARHRRCE